MIKRFDPLINCYLTSINGAAPHVAQRGLRLSSCWDALEAFLSKFLTMHGLLYCLQMYCTFCH